MNVGDEFIADECVRFFVHVLQQYVELDVDRDLCNMPSQIHFGEDVPFTHDIEKV